MKCSGMICILIVKYGLLHLRLKYVKTSTNMCSIINYVESEIYIRLIDLVNTLKSKCWIVIRSDCTLLFYHRLKRMWSLENQSEIQKILINYSFCIRNIIKSKKSKDYHSSSKTTISKRECHISWVNSNRRTDSK